MNIKKILLINPPYPFEESPSPPLGLSYLAGFLLKEGFEVKIADFVINLFSESKLNAIINEFKPDVIGSTGVTMNIKPAISILGLCRKIYPQAMIVLGGPHVTFDAEAILKENSFVDIIVRREGELTFTELLKQKSPLENIPGISYRNSTSIKHNPDRPFIEDINILPFPARDIIELSKYRALGMPINMITSRGCPFDCIFCVGSKMVGKKVRYYDTARVVDEFEMLSKMGFNQINIADDLFTSNKKRCTAICEEIIRRKINHPWTAFARVDTVSEELLTIMKKSGCTTLCFGIESGNQKILDTVKKKTSLDLCRKAVDICNKTGITPMAAYILGLPGETPETIEETLEFASRLNKLYGFHILSPFPGTEVLENADQYGLRILTKDWDMFDANQAVTESDTISKDEIDAVYKKFNSGIDKYVKGVISREESGAAISADEKSMVNNIRSIVLIKKIIDLELFEKFTNSDIKEKSKDSLAEFINTETQVDKNLIQNRIEWLIKTKSIEIRNENSDFKVQWAD